MTTIRTQSRYRAFLLAVVLGASLVLTLLPASPAHAGLNGCTGWVNLGFVGYDHDWYVRANVCVEDNELEVQQYARLRCHRTSDGAVVYSCRFDIRHLKLVRSGTTISDEHRRSGSRWVADWTVRGFGEFCDPVDDYKTLAQTIYVRTRDNDLSVVNNLNSATVTVNCQ
jgi:hypothetical protein